MIMEGTQGTHPSLLRPQKNGSNWVIPLLQDTSQSWHETGKMMEKWWKSLLSPSQIRVFITMTAMLTMILMGLTQLMGLWTSAQSLPRGMANERYTRYTYNDEIQELVGSATHSYLIYISTISNVCLKESQTNQRRKMKDSNIRQQHAYRTYSRSPELIIHVFSRFIEAIGLRRTGRSVEFWDPHGGDKWRIYAAKTSVNEPWRGYVMGNDKGYGNIYVAIYIYIHTIIHIYMILEDFGCVWK